jgi:NAD(P)-dependent dehydrogenase (short-subunit alcohol dehydrogenase family)
VARSLVETGVDAMFVRADVSREEDVVAMARAALARFGRVDAFIHAAGILLGAYQSVEELDLDTWNRVLQVNLTGTFLCAKYAAAALEQSGGAFICFGSGAGVRGGSSSLAYGASKGGVNGLMMTLASQFAARGIRAHIVCPGSINTAMKRQNIMDRARLSDQSPEEALAASRLPDPAGVARVVAFLVADEGGYMGNPLFTI